MAPRFTLTGLFFGREGHLAIPHIRFKLFLNNMDGFEEFLSRFAPLIILGLLALLIVTLLVLLVYSGLFASVDVKTGPPPMNKVVIAYKDGKGPYSNTGSFFSEAVSIAPDKKSIGIYYDNPEVVSHSFTCSYIITLEMVVLCEI